MTQSTIDGLDEGDLVPERPEQPGESAAYGEPEVVEFAELDDGPLPLVAYRVSRDHLDITPAPLRREWIDATSDRFASRCLPMLIANQAGWWLVNPETFVVRWDGSDQVSGLRIEYENVTRHHMVSSHFGYGIVTWRVPVLFRTPPGWNLLVRGPANLPKDGAWPLEGVVETDWAVASFTMNWKITRPGADVEFRAGEPFAMIVPQRRGELERFEPVKAHLSAMPDQEGYRSWYDSRLGFLVDRELARGREGVPQWQKDYMIGTAPGLGERFTGHQRRLRLQGFAAEADGSEPDDVPSQPPAVRCGRPPGPSGDGPGASAAKPSDP